MKLLTLNCHSWQEENQIEKIKTLAATIKEQSYDVIALQEVSQKMDSEQMIDGLRVDNFVVVLLQELEKLGVTDYNFTWDFSHLGFEVYEEGLAVLTKPPIIKTHSFFITQSHDTDYWKTRKIVGATIQVNNELLSFYSCHLGWWGDEEEPYQTQVESLCNAANREGTKYFLMGDFNNDANTRNEGYDDLVSKGLHDTYHLALEKDSGATVKGEIQGWDENKRDLRIDLILASYPFEIAKSKVVFNGENKPVVSDHYGLELEVNL
jgi:maltose 6'-phosphate phosphatase